MSIDLDAWQSDPLKFSLRFIIYVNFRARNLKEFIPEVVGSVLFMFDFDCCIEYSNSDQLIML